jgi:hypothetical protein
VNTYCLPIFQLRLRLSEKAKDGTLRPVANGEAVKAITQKKRGRWDQTGPDENAVPVKKANWEAEVILPKHCQL